MLNHVLKLSHPKERRKIKGVTQEKRKTLIYQDKLIPFTEGLVGLY